MEAMETEWMHKWVTQKQMTAMQHSEVMGIKTEAKNGKAERKSEPVVEMRVLAAPVHKEDVIVNRPVAKNAPRERSRSPLRTETNLVPVETNPGAHAG